MKGGAVSEIISLQETDFLRACDFWQKEGLRATVGFIFNRMRELNGTLHYHPREVHQLVASFEIQEVWVGALVRLAPGTVLFDPGTNDWAHPLCGLLERVKGETDVFCVRRFSPSELSMSLTIGPNHNMAANPGRIHWYLGPAEGVTIGTFSPWFLELVADEEGSGSSRMTEPIETVFVRRDRWETLLDRLGRWLPVESTDESSVE
ncbi:hypothetical protein COY93_03410 [Candidatus Uhrbacteria bacterium CG_4_10_14_0_8_um_filter_58_22]|uniref:Uncharacterized protein n=1 Tax=Candidatus Uhrbacteria bacterium CG_4_10_14_0_8_um_filter_58_22 TaxID=1975029 RepID=A0A2M7Q9F2_9BACT|nr:MAG: hypothetical protein AUJ19_01010 [Parcubacteria group bacterium CG1_02_58_44]PIY62321.1 MAG: hypothetical protein COY93_03410 [Candidatus Uhrbacteria bacterium CG_4_10_14_0_8_um_filter_58_22]